MANRNSGGITGKGGKNVNPVYNDSGGHVKKIVAGTKPLTRPKNVLSVDALRSPAEIRRMGGGAGAGAGWLPKNK